MSVLLKKQFLKQYAQNSVETSLENATPHKLVSMLYKGALDRMNQAKGYIAAKNYAKKGEAISRAMAIISSLRADLDFEKGGEVSQNLDALYEYMNRRLFEASRENSIEKVNEVINLLKPIAEAWEQMPDEFKKASEKELKQMALRAS